MLLSVRATLSGGRGHGLATGWGLAAMAAIWTTTALLGLEAVFILFPWAYVALKTAGALYLIWIAIGMFRQASEPLAASLSPAPRRRAFVAGMLGNLANPKSVIFAASVLLVIFPAGLTGTEKALIVLNHLTVELVAYSLFALALSTPPARDGYLRLKPVLDRIAAAVLGALGLRLLIDR